MRRGGELPEVNIRSETVCELDSAVRVGEAADGSEALSQDPCSVRRERKETCEVAGQLSSLKQNSGQKKSGESARKVVGVRTDGSVGCR